MFTQKIGCSVTDCSYNNASYCIAGQIKVGGANAHAPDSTNCESFTKGNFMPSITNAVGGNSVTSIDCDATTCQHNFKHMCNLSNVQVNSSCQGSECAAVAQTFCASFVE